MPVDGINGLSAIQNTTSPYANESARTKPQNEEAPDRPQETTTASTDKVDNEIASLKNEQAKLLKEIGATGDEAKKAELQKELDRVNNELRQKDNDAYRKANTEFTSGVDIMA